MGRSGTTGRGGAVWALAGAMGAVLGMATPAAITGTAVMVGAVAMPQAVAAQSAQDLERLRQQREALIRQRQEEEGTRSFQQVTGTGSNAAGGASAAASAGATSGGATVSTTPDASTGTSTASSGSGTAGTPTGTTVSADTPLALDDDIAVSRGIRFGHDSASLDDTARSVLDDLCLSMQADLALNPGSQYFVIGHTDASGSDAYNKVLSQRRADSAKQYLVDSCGLASAQLQAVGMGETRLLASASPRAGAQRRVEIQVKIDAGG
ncbi:MAG: OmpA family protein [Pseudomonadota bacterium]